MESGEWRVEGGERQPGLTKWVVAVFGGDQAEQRGPLSRERRALRGEERLRGAPRIFFFDYSHA